jgi:Zn ribbon nucleic-acid-binding protein
MLMVFKKKKFIMTSDNHRFNDENKTLSDFSDEVWVACPACSKRAIARAYFQLKKVRLFCVQCGYNKELSTEMEKNITANQPAHLLFYAELWLQTSFKNETFMAYNDRHLDYLERYISATLREHKERDHFTLLEKLPKFYHMAQNREGLLKIIAKLKNKL